MILFNRFLWALLLLCILSTIVTSNSLTTQNERHLTEANTNGFIVVRSDAVDITDDKGQVTPRFSKSQTEISRLIASNTSNDLFVIPDDQNYFRLQFDPSVAKPFRVRADPDNVRLKVRFTPVLHGVYESNAADPSSYKGEYYHPANKEGTTNNLYVQFFCLNSNDTHAVTFKYMLVERNDTPFTGPNLREFTLVKKYMVGKNTRLILKLSSDSVAAGLNTTYNISELVPITDPNHKKIIFEKPKVQLIIDSEPAHPQPIVSLNVVTPRSSPHLEPELIGDSAKGDIVESTNPVTLTLTLFCKARETLPKDNPLVLFIFSFHAPPYEDAEIPFYADCSKIANLERDLPLVVETALLRKDVMNLGRTQSKFHVKSDQSVTHLYEVPWEIGATEFLVYLDPSTSLAGLDTDTPKVTFDIELSYDKSRIEPTILDLPETNATITKEPKHMVLEYTCLKEGSTPVKVSFIGKQHKYDFSLKKYCRLPTHRSFERSQILHYLMMFAAICFGIYLIRVFKGLLVRERTKQSTTRTINVFNFRGTELRTQPITVLDDSLETDTRPEL